MDGPTMPCSGASPLLMWMHLFTTTLTTLLVAFLAQRRVRKDRVDRERWLWLNGGRWPTAHRTATGPRESKGEQ